MILNPGNKVAILLDAWHYWFPLIPIRITKRDSRGNGEVGVWRWFYVVQRKCMYSDETGCLMWEDYRDVIS